MSILTNQSPFCLLAWLSLSKPSYSGRCQTQLSIHFIPGAQSIVLVWGRCSARRVVANSDLQLCTRIGSTIYEPVLEIPTWGICALVVSCLPCLLFSARNENHRTG
ncbi:hypothetical protein XENTR_v10011316 [Xenopus tropicalis]|nr:hypothetical protein XENTR_v10011316 [Xenopus tropicalis]